MTGLKAKEIEVLYPDFIKVQVYQPEFEPWSF